MVNTVLSYLANGLSIIPVKPVEKTPIIKEWRSYQSRFPTEQEIKKWFSRKNVSPAIIAGKISGNLEMLDFDNFAQQFAQWLQLVKEQSPELASKLVVQSTQNAGMHVVYRCPTIDIPGNQKLSTGVEIVDREGEHIVNGKKFKAVAYRNKWCITQTLIETRGEGGYFLVTPGAGYIKIKNDFLTIPEITADERDILIQTALALNEFWPDSNQYYPHESRIDNERPGDRYDRETRIEDLIRDDGWIPAGRGGRLQDGTETQFFTRPGKTKGISATVYNNMIYVFTSNAPPLEPGKAYKPFGYYTVMRHHGDFSASARELSQIWSDMECNGLSRQDMESHHLSSRDTELLQTYRNRVTVLPSSVPIIEQKKREEKIAQKPIAVQVRDLFDEDDSILKLFDIFQHLDVRSQADKCTVRTAVSRLVKKGDVKKVVGKTATYRRCRAEAREMSFDSADEYPLDLVMPLGLSNLADICKGNLILVAGSPNAGKTGFLIQLLYTLITRNKKLINNINKPGNGTSGQMKTALKNEDSSAAFKSGSVLGLAENGIHYMNSEMNAHEMKGRLRMFPDYENVLLDGSVKFFECSRHFEDLIVPNGINLIDYLEIHEDFFELGKMIDSIYRELRDGICFINVQKKPGADYAKGGSSSLEKPRLVINLDDNAPYGHTCKIIKCKRPSIPGQNHNGKVKDYGFKGGELVSYSGWRHVSERDRVMINNSYEAQGLQIIPERNYEYVIWLKDGIARGIDPKMVDTWEENFPFIDVKRELQQFEINSRRSPLNADISGYFHIIAGYLNKKNSAMTPEEETKSSGPQQQLIN